MKFVALFLICVLPYLATGQTQYNTNITNAKKVEVHKGVLVIKNADTVMIRVYPSSKSKTKLFLRSVVEERDSTGMWTTTLTVKSDNEAEYTDVDIKLKFTDPIEWIKWETGLQFGTMDKEITDKISPRLKFRKCECDEGIIITIRSKQSTRFSIFGVTT